MTANLIIVDGLFPSPEEVRAFALAQDFSNPPTLDGCTYHGFSPIKDAAFGQYLSEHIAKASGFNVHVKNACVVVGTPEHTQQWIHADNPMADFAGVIYLFDRPGYGTAFWEHDHTQAEGQVLAVQRLLADGLEIEQITQRLQRDGKDASQWTRTDYADSKFNRLIFYPTDRFHSRWPQEAFGTAPENCRLTISLFFDIVR